MALNLKIIVCSTRPSRKGPIVAKWAEEAAKADGRFDVELIDLAEVDLPLLDEPEHPSQRKYQHEHTKRWSAMIESGDAFVFVTPEYDYFPPASVINAVQYLVHEWSKKPAGIVSYGGVSGGTRASQMLRLLLSDLGVMPLQQSVPIPFFAQFIENDQVKPNQQMTDGAKLMLNALHDWATTLKAMREAK